MPKAKNAPPADPNAPPESKHSKFKRLANGRVKRILAGLDGLAKLGSSAYERHPEDVSKLHGAIEEALDAAITALRPRRAGEKKTATYADIL